MEQAKQRRFRVAAEGSTSKHRSGTLTVSGLTFIGVGGIIGAGFFLGSGLPIRMAGPAVLIAFAIGALITSQVTGALTSMAVDNPVKGGYQAYPAMYVGPFAGFLQGWVYYVTSLMTISSEAVAMAIFVRLWLPRLPITLMAGVFIAIIIVINAFGVKNFERVESVMSAVKIAALVGFILFAAIVAVGALTHARSATPHVRLTGVFPTGFAGMMQGMLLVVFAYAGIGVFAAAAPETRVPRDIDRAAVRTVVILAILYIVSIALLLVLEPWHSINTATSPFVAALSHVGVRWAATLLNGVILVAAFSVMAGALYAANQVLGSLAHRKQAPRFVTRTSSKRGGPWAALLVSTVGMAVILSVSQLLPANVYNFLISATSFFTFQNWFLLMWAFLVWRKRMAGRDAYISKLAFGQPYSTVITMMVLLVLTGYALLEPDERVGFYAATAMALIVSACYWLFARGASGTRGKSVEHE